MCSDLYFRKVTLMAAAEDDMQIGITGAGGLIGGCSDDLRLVQPEEEHGEMKSFIFPET